MPPLVTIQTAVAVVSAITLFSGAVIAFYEFVIRRIRYSAVTLDLDVEPVCSKEDYVLVTISVVLANHGRTRIDARRQPRPRTGVASVPVYEEKETGFKLWNAGTLKIRPIPPSGDTRFL